MNEPIGGLILIWASIIGAWSAVATFAALGYPFPLYGIIVFSLMTGGGIVATVVEYQDRRY